MNTPQTTDALGSVAVYCAVATAAIQLLDWLLPPKAISRIREVLERIWLWLADQRVGRLLVFLQSPTVVRWVLVALVAVPLALLALQIVAVVADGGPIMVPEAIWIVFGFLPGAAFAFAILAVVAHFRVSRLAAWIVAKKSPTSTLVRTTALCAVSVAAVVPTVLFMSRTGGDQSGLSITLEFFVLGFVGAPALVLTVFSLAMALWFLMLGLVNIVLRLFEFLILRLAEYPKGPVLGASALLAALGGLLKALS